MSVQQFLNGKRIAVAGASRKGDTAGNTILKRLIATGYEAIAINPHAQIIDGVPCFKSLIDVPGNIDGVIVATHNKDSTTVVRDAIQKGITNIWFHKGLGRGSISTEAVAECKRHGIVPIVGGCPLMYIQPVDIFHKCLKAFTA